MKLKLGIFIIAILSIFIMSAMSLWINTVGINQDDYVLVAD